MIHFTDEEFVRLRNYVISNFGIDLTKKRILAECRMSNELEKLGIPAMGQFLDQMESDKSGRLQSILLNRLTTNYTYFMREMAHFEFLEKTILPELKGRSETEPYRIWSAGCSSGEECYSAAMVMKNYGMLGGWLPPYSIRGTDVSDRALKVAREGRYPLSELEKLPELWRKTFVEAEPGGRYFTVTPSVRANVEFLRMNLLKPYFGIREYDLIFCRNVMIYFDESSRRKLIENLYRSIKTDGYLFVGHTELLPRNHELFEYVCPAIYRKRGNVYG